MQERDQDEPMTPGLEMMSTPNFQEETNLIRQQRRPDNKPRTRKAMLLIEDDVDLMGPLRISRQQNIEDI